ncbi:LysR substrate-binding domain-containing protein [Poseidonocella sp. HB161398]|uniref:LysR substrate-binding domain-containing protein n=1 Tax=Poseidonocella sp. HB161398 TaxID=2320855 RepID=UPI00110997D7|nr:LysR substrate-binding domain-containing protein [Poseidonocella sp. HB161398]
MLPPFRAITAFHATARTGSMQAASDVLGVTPSAVSQQIQAIEAHIGVRLFSRTGRKVVLTEAGERYYELIRDEIERITVATEQMRGLSSFTVLNIRVAPTFANKWVLPRLPDFIEKHPDIELRLDATNDPPDFTRENIDLEIRHGAGDWRGMYVECLADEQVQVLCAPEYAAPASLDIEDLPDHRLIHSVKNVTQWARWFELQGYAPDKPLCRTLFDRAHMSIDMAASGLGIALESRLTASAELASGRLVCPMRPGLRDVWQQSLWLVCPSAHLNRRKVRRFIDWLKSTLEHIDSGPARTSGAGNGRCPAAGDDEGAAGFS